jgi:hypothetical protein
VIDAWANLGSTFRKSIYAIRFERVRRFDPINRDSGEAFEL